jgi:hypothetical protein
LDYIHRYFEEGWRRNYHPQAAIASVSLTVALVALTRYNENSIQ